MRRSPFSEGGKPKFDSEMRHLEDFQEAHRQFLAHMREAKQSSSDTTVPRSVKREFFFQLLEKNTELLEKMRVAVQGNKDNQVILETVERQMEAFQKMYRQLYKPR